MSMGSAAFGIAIGTQMPPMGAQRFRSSISVEDPPDYYEGLPTYRLQHAQPPVTSYTFYQRDKNSQVLEPDRDSRLRNGYTIHYHKSGMFSKKPDIALVQTIGPREVPREGWDNVIYMNKTVATVTYQKGSSPALPRAHIVQRDKTCTMECRDDSTWTFSVDGLEFSWKVDNDLPSFVLRDSSSDTILARFTFGTLGTRADKGAEIGEFAFFGGHQSNEQCMIELLILSYSVAVTQYTSKGTVIKSHDQTASHRILRNYRDNTLRSAVMAMSGTSWNVS